MKIALYNYICGSHLYKLAQDRLARTTICFHCDKFLINEYDRPHWPSHDKINYVFKAGCLKEAIDNGYDWFIWADAKMMFHKNWQYLINMFRESDIIVPFNGFPDCFWSVGQWTKDELLDHFAINRDNAFDIPTVVSGFFAINLNSEIGKTISQEFIEISLNPVLANGPRYTNNTILLHNRAYLGHRHDQSILSLLVHKHNVTPKLGIYADPTNAVGLPKTLNLTKETVIVWQPI